MSWRILDSDAAHGVVLIVAGFSIFVAALLGLGNSWRLGIDEDTPGDLVTGQIYALIARAGRYVTLGRDGM